MHTGHVYVFISRMTAMHRQCIHLHVISLNPFIIYSYLYKSDICIVSAMFTTMVLITLLRIEIKRNIADFSGDLHFLK